jgi:hypothetical protein
MAALAVGGGAVVAVAAPTATTVNVSTAAQLTAALSAAKPGETIQLAAGKYSGTFIATTSGTASQPITLSGPAGAILNNGTNPTKIGSSYGFHLEADFWHLTGFTVDNSAKGVVLDKANNDVIDGLTVFNIGDEGIHLRDFSSNDTVENCVIHDTGKQSPGFGEGLYIGTAVSNWPSITGGKPDLSNNEKVMNNTFGPNVAAENIDAKEATVGTVITGNTFSGKGESGQNFSTDVVAVKGNGYTVTGNKMSNGLTDGFEVEQLVAKSGCGNTFKNNTINLNAPGFGFDVKDQSNCKNSPNVVGTSNTVTGAGKGASKIPETPGV